MGASSGLKSARILRRYFENVRGSSPGTTKSLNTSPNSRSLSPGGAYAACHTPERSGLPLEALGVLAARFGVPSRVRGVPGVGYCSHCAWVLIVRNTNIPATRGFDIFNLLELQCYCSGGAG